MNWKNLTGLVFLAAGLSQAHLVANSLTPKGGEVLKVGAIVSITWNVEEIHGDGIDIALSKDGGKTFANIKSGFNDNAKSDTFKWTVPADAVTANGKLRICQSGPCTDANNVSRASGNGGPWVLVSGLVTVQASTAVNAPEADLSGADMGFNPATRNVDVSFGLAAAADVRLDAFDTQGRLVATLIEGNYAAGSHALSVFSNRLTTSGGSLIFKLQAGGQVKTLHWMAVR
jgi:hypothetical protein